MPSVPREPLDQNEQNAMLSPFEDVLVSLVEFGCQYLRDHPEVRIQITHSGLPSGITIDLSKVIRVTESDR